MNVERPSYGVLGSRDIAQLIAVADHGSIRRAADALGMTQPGLSKNIRLIEARLGMTVFERSTSGAVATDIGTLLLRRGRQILLDLEAIHRDLRDELLSESGLVRIGVGPIPAPVISRLVIGQCHRAHPGISIEMDVGTPAVQFPRVERGEIDMFIGNCDAVEVPSSVALHTIGTLVPVFFVRAGHPLAAYKSLNVRDLAGQKIACVRTTPPFLNWFQTAMAAPVDIALQCDDFEILANAVETSDLLSFGSRRIVALLQRHHDIVMLDVAGIDYHHTLHCAQPAARPLARTAQMVLRLVPRQHLWPIIGVEI